MTRIQGEILGDQVVLPRRDLELLVQIASKNEAIDLELLAMETTTRDILALAETGRAFDFWNEPGENVYSIDDGKPV